VSPEFRHIATSTPTGQTTFFTRLVTSEVDDMESNAFLLYYVRSLEFSNFQLPKYEMGMFKPSSCFSTNE